MQVMRNISLLPYTNYRIGGPADYFIRAATIRDIGNAAARAERTRAPLFILGGGTNILVGDAGVRGIVLKPEFTTLSVQGTRITAGAGVLMGDVVSFAAQHGLSGLEWAGGLPGTVGGAVRGNAGAFGGETKDSVETVTSVPLEPEPTPILRMREACRFGYRTSVFKEMDGREVIVGATFALRPGDPARIRAVSDERIRYRIERHPMEYPNIGSIFKNVDIRKVPQRFQRELAHIIKTDPFPVVPTAYLLGEAGLKGVSAGGAMFSPKHPNFIVNVLAARAADVKTLIALAKFRIKERFGIVLEEEIIYVGV